MSDFERKAIEHLRSLAKAARAHWTGESGIVTHKGEPIVLKESMIDDYFETELVRAEDFLEEVVGDADI